MKRTKVCIFMDLFARKIVAWKINARINTQFVVDTFLLAYKNRACPSGVIFHSDRSSPYTSKIFRMLLDKVNFTVSYSKRSYPYANAVAEA